MTVRQQLEIHRLDANCASCHDKIDPLGFALEGFGPDGLKRLKDQGVEVDDSAQMKNNKPFKGLEGLKVFLSTQEDDLLKQVCHKFIGYALGREVEIGDRELLDTMVKSLKENDLKFSAMVRPLIHSKVFQTRRGKDGAA